jgi:methanogenic corrinoid protein MtbC1
MNAAPAGFDRDRDLPPGFAAFYEALHEKFAARARELDADIVGVSALLTTTMRNQKTVIDVLDKTGLRSRVKIMVGGAPVTRRWAEEIGADGYAKDAMSAVALAQELMQQKLQTVCDQNLNCSKNR